MIRTAWHLAAVFLVVIGISGVVSTAAAQQAQQPQNATPNQDVGLGIRGIGARIGVVDPEDASTTLSLGGHLDAGTIVRNVHLVPYIEYWSTGADAGAYNVNYKDWTLGTDVNVDFPLQGQRMTPYLGGGLGLHLLSYDTTVPGDVSSDHSKLGLNIQGGIRNQMWPNLSLFGEVKYAFVSDSNQLKLMGGFTYNFIY